MPVSNPFSQKKRICSKTNSKILFIKKAMKNKTLLITSPFLGALLVLFGITWMGVTCTRPCSARLNAGVSLVPCNECQDIDNCPFKEVATCPGDTAYLCWNANNATSIKIDEYDEDNVLVRSLGNDFPLSGELLVVLNGDRSFTFTRVGGACPQNRSKRASVNVIVGRDSMQFHPYGPMGLTTNFRVNPQGFPQFEYWGHFAQISSKITTIGAITLCDDNCWGPAIIPNNTQLLICSNKPCYAHWTLNKWDNASSGPPDDIKVITPLGARFRPGFQTSGQYHFVSNFPINPQWAEKNQISANFRVYLTCNN